MSKLKRALVAAVTATFLALGLTGCGVNDDFNGWLSARHAEEGQPVLMHMGEWSTRYECFRDGEIIVVPGYEGE